VPRGLDGTASLIPGAVVVCEVVSPTSERCDRFAKAGEYAALFSVRRYAIAEHTMAGPTVLDRAGEGVPWTLTTLVSGKVLRMPEEGIEVPVEAVYAAVTFAPMSGEESGGSPLS